jgi:CBS domain-containing protein
MFAATLISYAVPPLKMSDSGDKALSWMSDFHVRHLPIVGNDGSLVGIISEDEVLNFLEPDLSLAENEPELILKFVYDYQHLYDVMKLIVDSNLSVIPVLNKEKKYIGIITLEILIKHLADSGAVTHPGGILVLEMSPRDYSLAEIARLIEGEKAMILSSFITSPYGKDALELTLKLNKEDLKHVIATLERFGYTVKASFHESDALDLLQDRYDLLMKIINM